MELIRVLHLEDVASDAELVRRELSVAGLRCEITWVEDEQSFRAALDRGASDIVLADNALPGLDGRDALQLSRESMPNAPFIVVTGSLGEEYAVEMLQLGATDFVLKDRLGRLAPAVRRALRETDERRRRRESESLVREQAAILDLAPIAFLVRGFDDRVRFWSKGAERIYGWPAEEVVGGEVNSLWPKLPEAAFTEARARTLDTGEWSGEFSLTTRSGRSVVVASRWTLLRDDLGRPRSMLVSDTDVTHKHALAAQLLRAQRSESIGTLAGGIAHDLNNILSPILMAVEILKRRMAGDARSLKTLANIETSATRGAALVRQIVGFTRGVPGARLGLAVPDLIADLERSLASTLPASIELRIAAAPDLWGVIGDATQLHQVLLNLCDNAREAMPGGGVLEIAARNVMLDPTQDINMEGVARAGRHVELTVRDNGTGIAPEVLDRIFEPFFTTKPVGQGTGLSLSTSVGIIKSHGGSISASSEPGRGSTFRVCLPAAPDSDPRSAEADAAQGVSGGRERILVIDDEPALLELMRETLEVAGYSVVTAAGGAAAAELYAQPGAHIAAVITDLSMAGMSGYATVRKLRGIDPGVRLIVISGLGPEDVAPAQVDGVQAFLRKPVPPARLLSTLRAVLDGQPT